MKTKTRETQKQNRTVVLDEDAIASILAEVNSDEGSPNEGYEDVPYIIPLEAVGQYQIAY